MIANILLVEFTVKRDTSTFRLDNTQAFLLQGSASLTPWDYLLCPGHFKLIKDFCGCTSRLKIERNNNTILLFYYFHFTPNSLGQEKFIKLGLAKWYSSSKKSCRRWQSTGREWSMMNTVWCIVLIGAKVSVAVIQSQVWLIQSGLRADIDLWSTWRLLPACLWSSGAEELKDPPSKPLRVTCNAMLGWRMKHLFLIRRTLEIFHNLRNCMWFEERFSCEYSWSCDVDLTEYLAKLSKITNHRECFSLVLHKIRLK